MLRILLGCALGLILATYLVVIVTGIPGAGQPAPIGVSHRIARDRFAYTSVTPAGARGGVRVGDVLDTRLMTVAQRMTWWNQIGNAQTTGELPLVRGNHVVNVRRTFEPLSQDREFVDSVILALVFTSGVCGLILLVRGRDAPSLAAGIAFVALSFYQAFATFSPWNAPQWLSLALNLLTIVAISAFSIAAFALAMLLLPKAVSLTIRILLTIVAGFAILATFLLWTFDYSLWMFSGDTIFNGQSSFVFSRLAELAVIALTFGVAAVTVRGKASAAVRVLFAATLVGFAAEAYKLIAGQFGWVLSPPARVLWALGWCLLFAGYLYALFAKRLVALDFVVNRTAVFAAIVAFVSAFLIIVEKIIERFTLGPTTGFLVELAATLVIALSFKWTERRLQGLVERVFYRDKLHAAGALAALADDFPFVKNAGILVGLVSREVHRNIKTPRATVYLAKSGEYCPVSCNGETADGLGDIPDSDPAILRLQSRKSPLDSRSFVTDFPRNATLFPLVVFGKVIGCLCLDERANGEDFDPDERSTIMDLVHEFAAALTWLNSSQSAPSSKEQRFGVAR